MGRRLSLNNRVDTDVYSRSQFYQKYNNNYRGLGLTLLL